jgi:hypothetical protein
MANILPILTLEAQLKRAFRLHLNELGFTRKRNGWLQPAANDKEAIRTLHRHQRKDKLNRETVFIQKNHDKLLRYFADGAEIDPKRIRPLLIEVKSKTVEADLFRFATLLWSIPVSEGYGRRLRFLVMDASRNRLMGLFALGDPVFNLRARDRWIDWDAEDRRKRLSNVMDCYVLGAVPPYNSLLCAKMIACMVRSKEVWGTFRNKYSEKKGIISGEFKNPQLALVTTTSALGRSSVYNRLHINGRQYFESVGYTSGWGHFHIPDMLYSKIREYLLKKKHPYADNNRFGDGPNWRLRTIRAALELLGFDPNILCHGVAREVFACEFASNSRDYLGGRSKKLRVDCLPLYETTAELALHRWIVPRSERYQDFKLWKKELILDAIKCSNSLTAEDRNKQSESMNLTKCGLIRR